MDEAIINYVKRKYNLLIGERTAELIKIEIGTAYPGPRRSTAMEVKGRDLVAGVPKTIEIKSEEVREALLEPVNAVVESVKIALERTPPELAADIVDKGIVLVGGGALLRNLDVLLRERPGLAGHAGRGPAHRRSVIGTGRCLDELDAAEGRLAHPCRSPDRPVPGAEAGHGELPADRLRLSELFAGPSWLPPLL